MDIHKYALTRAHTRAHTLMLDAHAHARRTSSCVMHMLMREAHSNARRTCPHLCRLALAEKLRAPWRRASRRPDPASIATREATKLEAEGGTGAPLDFCVKMMFIGLAGGGAGLCWMWMWVLVIGFLAKHPNSSKDKVKKPILLSFQQLVIDLNLTGLR
jgi:hypothetical protein